MDAEDPLFILYTSGFTGQSKGLLHTTGGYLLYAAITRKYISKTRSGKIMRRILRKIATNEIDSLDDTSTLADPDVVKNIIENHLNR